MNNYSDVTQGLSGGALTAYWIVMLIICILLIIAYWKLFEKAGEAGWKSIIPFYNTYILTKIATGNGLLFLLILIPFVGALIWDILVSVKLSKAFGHGIGFTLGLIFIPNIFYLILGFGSDQYIGPQ